jgi:hypothetical protein
MSDIICDICGKSFNSNSALSGHRRMHGPSRGKIKKHKIVIHPAKLAYLAHPKKCLQCCNSIPWNNRKGIFCSQSCSATYNNSGTTHTEQTKQKISKSLIFDTCTLTKIRFSKCRVTNKYYVSNINGVKQRNPYYQTPIKKEYRRKCNFTFDIFDYAEEFSVSSNTSFYSGRKNPDTSALTKDHMYSVYDGFNNNIPFDIIAHPANCRLITQLDNVKKGKKSVISIEELYMRIEVWNKKYPPQSS